MSSSAAPSPTTTADAKSADPEFERLVASITGSVCRRANQRLTTCLRMLDRKPKVTFTIHCKTPTDKTDHLDFMALSMLASASDIPHSTAFSPDGLQLIVNFFRSWEETPISARRHRSGSATKSA